MVAASRMIFLSTIVASLHLVACAQFPVVETEGITYQGTLTRNNTAAVFYGIPYAEPPLGQRRFRAPVPIKRSHSPGKTVVDASKEPNFCIQSIYRPSEGIHGGAGSEDCLNLNIYVPPRVLRSRPSSAKLPTLVFIHGGGFIAGNPLASPFDHWVGQFPDVVIVAVYYRLGVFGFLSAPDAKGALDYNVGFLDQLAALKWVKENIADFGGDPQKVTIDGQSAGGMAMALHLVANGGKQTLFQQVIGQSMWRSSLMTAAETQPRFDFMMAEAGCAIAGYSNAQKIDCYRDKDISTLIRSSENAMTKNISWIPSPVIDGTIFSDRPTKLINEGKFSKVPVLVGATTDENVFISSSLQTDFSMWWPATANLSEIERIYPSSDFANETTRLQTANGELIFRCPHIAEAQTAVGKPAYAYRFNTANPTQVGDTTVRHAAECWWMLQGSNSGENGTYTLTPFTSLQSSFAKELLAYWISFVRSGDPNTHRLQGSPIWPKWENGYSGSNSTSPKGKRMVLEEGSMVGNSGNYQSGSHVEQEPAKELGRCHALAALAPVLHI